MCIHKNITCTKAIYEDVRFDVGADAHEVPKHGAVARTVTPLPEQKLLNLIIKCLMCVKTGCRNRNRSEQKTTPTTKQTPARELAQSVTILSVIDSDECVLHKFWGLGYGVVLNRK
jgi:hypothetical protein